MKILKAAVSDEYFQRISDYADANNRSLKGLIVHALERYMRENPVAVDSTHNITQE